MKALIVDDSVTMRRILANVLGQMGIEECGQAADGVEAVQAVAADTYGLVLLDWNMPNMCGIDALRQIRAAGHTMPVIMVTTEAEKTRVLEALKAGATSYIIKPFKPEGVIQKVQDVLARASA